MSDRSSPLQQAAARAHLEYPVFPGHMGLLAYKKAALGGILVGVIAMSSLWWGQYASAQPDSAIFRLGVPALGALVLIISAVVYVRLAVRRVVLFANGFACREGWSVVAVPFSEIVAVRAELTQVHNAAGGHYRGRLEVHRADRSVVRVSPNIEGLEIVLATLIRRSGPSVIAAVTGSLRQGRGVPSGAIELTPAGIAHRGRVMPYHTVTRVWERSKAALIGNKTTVLLCIQSEDGDAVEVPANKVLHRHHLEKIARKMARYEYEPQVAT